MHNSISHLRPAGKKSNSMIGYMNLEANNKVRLIRNEDEREAAMSEIST